MTIPLRAQPNIGLIYDANHREPITLGDAKAAVGRRATLPLTGTIINADNSNNYGPYVEFEIDSRWGFGTVVLRLDLNALDIQHHNRREQS